MVITLSTSAADRILQLMADKSQYFKLEVLGGGCSGFQYNFEIVDEKSEDDLVFETGGVRVITDTVSHEFLDGTEVDYVTELVGSSFQINNPNAASGCGCGSSFAV